MDIAEAVSRVITEYHRAASRFGPFASPHEGHAIIREEFEEQWEAIKAVKWDRPGEDLTPITEESVQLAAMALRFLIDLIPGESLEDRTRRELAEAASTVEPSPDALEAIRERTRGDHG